MLNPLSKMRLLVSDFEVLITPQPVPLDTIEIIRNPGDYDPEGGEFSQLVNVVCSTLAVLRESKVIETEVGKERPDFDTPILSALAHVTGNDSIKPPSVNDYAPTPYYDTVDLVLKTWAVKNRSWPSGSSIAIHENIIRSKLFTDEDRAYMYEQARERRRRLITSSLKGRPLIAGLTDGIDLITSPDLSTTVTITSNESDATD